jgi:hypothetical protein
LKTGGILLPLESAALKKSPMAAKWKKRGSQHIAIDITPIRKQLRKLQFGKILGKR